MLVMLVSNFDIMLMEAGAICLRFAVRTLGESKWEPVCICLLKQIWPKCCIMVCQNCMFVGRDLVQLLFAGDDQFWDDIFEIL